MRMRLSIRQVARTFQWHDPPLRAAQKPRILIDNVHSCTTQATNTRTKHRKRKRKQTSFFFTLFVDIMLTEREGYHNDTCD